MLLNGFVLLTCFIITTYYYIYIYSNTNDEVFMILELDEEYPPGVLSQVATCRCAPLNQCDTKSCSDGISMIIAITLLMYQVDYNEL